MPILKNHLSDDVAQNDAFSGFWAFVQQISVLPPIFLRMVFSSLEAFG